MNHFANAGTMTERPKLCGRQLLKIEKKSRPSVVFGGKEIA